MKKKLITIFGMLIIVTVIAFNFNRRNNEANLSALSLMNIEMLAQAYELPEVSITCGSYDGPCWEHDFYTWFAPCRWNGYQYYYCRK